MLIKSKVFYLFFIVNFTFDIKYDEIVKQINQSVLLSVTKINSRSWIAKPYC